MAQNIVLCCVPVKSYKMVNTSNSEIVKSPSTWEEIVEGVARSGMWRLATRIRRLPPRGIYPASAVSAVPDDSD